jgi:hypothetical protein
MAIDIRRREFIAGLGSAAACPVVAGAQQPQHVRRVGFFFTLQPSDPIGQQFTQALLQALQELGWIVGTNLEIDIRFGGISDIGQIQATAEELVATQPDLIQTAASLGTAAILKQHAPFRLYSASFRIPSARALSTVSPIRVAMPLVWLIWTARWVASGCKF